MEYKIRQMCDEDVPQAAKLEKICFSEPWSEQGFLDGIKQEQNLFLAAVEKQEQNLFLAGYVGMYVAGDEGEITNVAVHPDFRRQGIGKKLLQHLLLMSRQRGISRIVLEVRVSNRAAILLYEETGFSAAGVRKGFYAMPREDALIMVWEE